MKNIKLTDINNSNKNCFDLFIRSEHLSAYLPKIGQHIIEIINEILLNS